MHNFSKSSFKLASNEPMLNSPAHTFTESLLWFSSNLVGLLKKGKSFIFSYAATKTRILGILSVLNESEDFLTRNLNGADQASFFISNVSISSGKIRKLMLI